MQRTIKLAAVAAIATAAGTAGAFADEFDYGYARGPAYEEGYVTTPTYYRGYGPGYGYYGNGSNHPTPSSTQGDVGPGGNNNGTLSGHERYKPW